MAARVALVGRRLEHNENLGLAYLRAALRTAGVLVTTHYVNDTVEMASAIGGILAARPDVVGLSLADGGSATLPLAVGEAITQGGYRGHITAGGQFATLAREWLLSRYEWLDSVVRFAGERPIVEITSRVLRGEDVHGIAGVTTRAGDGAPARVLDDTPMKTRPERDELPEILGHPAAHIAASRGCLGRCQYCGPAALYTLERREGSRAGVDRETLNQAGVGGVRWRAIDDVCDEMADLWHGRGVRYFYFVDEHPLPYTEPEALDHLARWKEGLRARRVGPLGIGTMLRADRVTPPMVKAFCDVGLVRAFIGLEVVTDEEGRRFGRHAPGPRELALLRDFAREGVVTISNLMLVNPYSTPASIRAGIDLLERLPSGVFEATKMMVYHGTRLMKTMTEEGRLAGNPFRYAYSFEDPVIERFAEIFARLRAEAFYDYSLAGRTHDAFLAIALARRIHPERVVRGLEDKLDAARRKVNLLYVSAYREALRIAEEGGGFVEAGELLRALGPRVAAIQSDLGIIEARLEEVAPSRGGPFAPMRSAAASVVSFVLAAGCGGESRRGSSSDPTTVVIATEREDAAAPAPVEPAPDAGDAGDAGGGARICTDAEVDALGEMTRQHLAGAAACFSGIVTLGSTPSARSTLSVRGMCNVQEGDHAAQATRALAGHGSTCVDPRGDPVRVIVQGDTQKQLDAARTAILACSGNRGGAKIEVDAKGLVTGVDAGGATAYAKCIQRVLSGLRFPCLRHFEVCPEHIIYE